jgi:hypothetical protein
MYTNSYKSVLSDIQCLKTVCSTNNITGAQLIRDCVPITKLKDIHKASCIVAEVLSFSGITLNVNELNHSLQNQNWHGAKNKAESNYTLSTKRNLQT